MEKKKINEGVLGLSADSNSTGSIGIKGSGQALNFSFIIIIIITFEQNPIRFQT
jgi:hypothetical protein